MDKQTLLELKWLRSGKMLSKAVLRSCFFAYVFPHFAWIFPFFPFLPLTYQELFRRKYRVAIRLFHRAPFVGSSDLFTLTHEDTLDTYVKLYVSDLGYSLFLEDILRYFLLGYFPETSKR
jgi:hypothetical protein